MQRGKRRTIIVIVFVPVIEIGKIEDEKEQQKPKTKGIT
jgi:hypothetical protein